MVERVVLKVLAKDHKQRFASVQEFTQALATAIEQSGRFEATEDFVGFRKNDPEAFQEGLKVTGQQTVDDFTRVIGF